MAPAGHSAQDSTRSGATGHRSRLSPMRPVPAESAVVEAQPRKVPDLTRLLLFVRSGGRCELDGCNEYLLEHHVTRGTGVYGQMAHVVAFRSNGPRGGGQLQGGVHDPSNLMLLCGGCHKEVDSWPDRYTREVLENHKAIHEARILEATSVGPDRQTAVLIVKARIGDQPVALNLTQVVDATRPRYPSSGRPLTIDLTGSTVEGPEFLASATKEIQRRVAAFLSPEGEGGRIGHVSVFALAPIPVLIHLGRQLSTKVPTDVFQRHRDDEGWTWKKTGRRVRFVRNLLSRGGANHVAVVLSLSGRIRLQDLPADVRANATVYELTLEGQAPKVTFLRRKRDLDEFRVAYQELLGDIVEAHGLVPSFDLFPAVPAPVAVLCGRELLPKVHPRCRVYDYDKSNGGFMFQLEV